MLEPMGGLTKADIDEYSAKGALCVRKLLDKEWVERLRVAAARVIETMLKAREADGTPRPTTPAFHACVGMFVYDPDFEGAAFKSRAPRVAMDLTQCDMLVRC